MFELSMVIDRMSLSPGEKMGLVELRAINEEGKPLVQNYMNVKMPEDFIKSHKIGDSFAVVVVDEAEANEVKRKVREMKELACGNPLGNPKALAKMDRYAKEASNG